MMLIPAITEAILAMAAGSIAGVAKAIEFGLVKLITLVINLFAKLIGLGGLSKKVQAIFKKIRKRVDKAVTKLLRKAKRAGRKLMGKLEFAKTTKGKSTEHDPGKQKKIDVALMDLNKEEKKYSNSDKISHANAQKVATIIKSRHKVFKTFKVIDGKNRWDYAYTASPKTIVEGKKKEVNAKISGELLSRQEIAAKTDLTIVDKEERVNEAIVGYQAAEPNSVKVGFIVGRSGSEKAYIKERREKRDFREQFNKLKNLSVSKRREQINKGIGGHSDFKPINVDLKSVDEGRKVLLTYKYDKEAHKLGQQDFTVTFVVRSDSQLTQATTGMNLALKTPGTRGYTHRAGLIAKRDYGINLNSAHILGDQFMG